MAEPASPAPELPGFSVLERAGRGGMGTVFIAEQHSPRRKVALKLLSRAPDAKTLADFRREAAAIARLEHPRIVPLYGYGEQAGLPYLVMRHLSGGSLADLIRSGPLELEEAERWLVEIAEALDFAHASGLVHRDIKPSNILLDQQGNAYLSDFGIAGTLADAESGLPTGSAAYMSPEQGQGLAVDGRADVYSLAVSLFEALTGQKPYTAETALGVIVRHTHDPIPSARAINPTVPPAVEAALRWGMAKDPRQRPQSAGEFARAVSQAIRHPEAPLPTMGAASPAAGARVEAPTKPRGRLGLAIGVAVIGIGAIVLVGGGLVAALLLSSDAEQPATATPPAGQTGAAVPTPAGQLLQEDFSGRGSAFILSPPDPDGGVELAEGGLRITALTEGVRWHSPSGRVEIQDVEMEATARMSSGPPGSEIALICRYLDLGNYTALGLRADGMAALWQVREEAVTWLTEWAPVPGLEIGPGQTVQLRAACQGDQLQLQANGIRAAEGRDPNPISGDVAVMAGLAEAGQLVVYFDDVLVSR